MTARTWLKYYTVVSVAVIGVLSGGLNWQWGAVSVFSGIMLAPIFTTWLVRNPWPWLMLLSFFSEVRALLPLGMAGLAVWWPWIWQRWLKSESPDGSIRYVTAIVGASACQVATLLLGEWAQVSSGESLNVTWWLNLPWLLLLIRWLITSVVAVTLVWLIHTIWWPSGDESVSAISQQRIKYI